MLKIVKLLGVTLAMIFATASYATECSDVEFNDELNNKFPKINEACLRVLDYQGSQYANLEAKIISANSRYVALRWKGQDGDYIDEVFRSNRLPSDFRANVAGQDVRAGDLMRGQELNVYVKLGGEMAMLMAEEGIETTSSVDNEIAFEPAPVAMPTTASILPMLGLFGFISIGFGFMIRLMRKKDS